jgi:hypothetical protein
MINAPQRRLGAVYEVDGVELEAVIVAHEGKENLARLMASAAADHAGLRLGLCAVCRVAYVSSVQPREGASRNRPLA